MKTQYDIIQNIFIQSSLTNILLTQKVQALKSPNNPQFYFTGEFNYLCWRYVYMKDITNKAITNKLLKLGFDNLTVVEILNTLNLTRKMVKDLLDEAKEQGL
jgi:hypothetical protein